MGVSSNQEAMLKLPSPCFCTLTFCDSGENSVGMEIIGQRSEVLVTMGMLEEMKARFEGVGGKAEMVDLKAVLGGKAPPGKAVREAGVLVLRDFVKVVHGEETLRRVEHELQQQQEDGKLDSKAFMRGGVKNKAARHNNVIAGFAQAPDYANKKGTIVPWSSCPAIAKMGASAKEWMKQPHELVCEQNRYFDVKSCGIGFHGDAERNVVMGLRVGEACKRAPLMFRWYHDEQPISEVVRVELRHGDAYVMSDWAVGVKWRSKSLVTLRHAAGAPSCKYSKPAVAKRHVALVALVAGEREEKRGEKRGREDEEKCEGEEAEAEEEDEDDMPLSEVMVRFYAKLQRV